MITLSLIQTQHHGDWSATKRAATSFLFYQCPTRRTEVLIAARDQCMKCLMLFNEADLTEVGRLYGMLTERRYCWRLERRYATCTWRSIRFLFPIIPVPNFPVSHFQRPHAVGCVQEVAAWLATTWQLARFIEFCNIDHFECNSMTYNDSRSLRTPDCASTRLTNQRNNIVTSRY